jgi:hypothetical protein
MGAELFHANGQRAMTKLTVAFRTLANASTKSRLLNWVSSYLAQQFKLLPLKVFIWPTFGFCQTGEASPLALP